MKPFHVLLAAIGGATLLATPAAAVLGLYVGYRTYSRPAPTVTIRYVDRVKSAQSPPAGATARSPSASPEATSSSRSR
jgi:hypothetical protein